MIKVLSSIFILLFCFSQANAIETECPVYTQEQEDALKLAYSVGYEDDLGLTLAAIVVQESFVGPYIVKVNTEDRSKFLLKGGRATIVHGSYGLGHTTVGTLGFLLGEKNLWKVKAKYIPKLLSDDKFSSKMILMKLLSVKSSTTPWREMVSRYNGSGPDAHKYMLKIVEIVKTFKKCGTFVHPMYLDTDQKSNSLLWKFDIDLREEK